jgi:hypothetical protein
MPSFYPGGPDNILEGKDDRQIDALRDYLLTLGRSGGNGADGQAKPATTKTAAAR